MERRAGTAFGISLLLAFSLAAGLAGPAGARGASGLVLPLGERGALRVLDDGTFGLLRGTELVNLSSHWSLQLQDGWLEPEMPSFERDVASPLNGDSRSARMLLFRGSVMMELAFRAEGASALVAATVLNTGGLEEHVRLGCALEFHLPQVILSAEGPVFNEGTFHPEAAHALTGIAGDEELLSMVMLERPSCLTLLRGPLPLDRSAWDRSPDLNASLGDPTVALLSWDDVTLAPGGFLRARLLLSAGPPEGVVPAGTDLRAVNLTISPEMALEQRPRRLTLGAENRGGELGTEAAVLFILEGRCAESGLLPLGPGWTGGIQADHYWVPSEAGNYTVLAVLPLALDIGPADNILSGSARVLHDPYGFLMRFSSLEAVYRNSSHPGGRVRAQLYIYNTGEAPDSVRLRTEGIPDGWTVLLTSNLARLGVGEVASIELFVKPSHAAGNGSHSFVLLGASVATGDEQALLIVVDIAPLPPETAPPHVPLPTVPGSGNPPVIPVHPYPRSYGSGEGFQPFGPGTPLTAVALSAIGVALALALLGVALYQAAGLHALTLMQKLIKRALYKLEAGDEYRKTIFSAYRKMCSHFARYGYTREDHVTPREFARLLRLSTPLDTKAIRLLTRLFEEARYSDHELDEGRRRAALESLRYIEGELDRLTVFLGHESRWDRLKRRMGWGEA